MRAVLTDMTNVNRPTITLNVSSLVTDPVCRLHSFKGVRRMPYYAADYANAPASIAEVARIAGTYSDLHVSSTDWRVAITS